MSSFITRALLIPFLLAPCLSHAGLLLEPSFGFEKQSLIGSSSMGEEASGAATGYNVGMRVGYNRLYRFFVAFDYQMLMATSFSADNPGYDGYQVARRNLYFVLGYDFLVARFWLGYSLQQQLSFAKNESQHDDFTGTGSLKFGLGFTVARTFSVNLEYQMNRYTDFSHDGAPAADIGTGYSKFYDDSVLLTASMPFAF